MITKPPWTIESPCGFPYSGIYIVPTVRKDFPFYIAKIRQLREREESEDNACLIAVAPELLSVCKDFFEWHANHFEDFSDEINGQLLCLANNAEQAIASAEKQA